VFVAIPATSLATVVTAVLAIAGSEDTLSGQALLSASARAVVRTGAAVLAGTGLTNGVAAAALIGDSVAVVVDAVAADLLRRYALNGTDQTEAELPQPGIG